MTSKIASFFETLCGKQSTDEIEKEVTGLAEAAEKIISGDFAGGAIEIVETTVNFVTAENHIFSEAHKVTVMGDSNTVMPHPILVH